MSCNKFVNTTLGNIAQITMGQSPKGSSLNKFRKGVPFIQGNRTFGFLYPTIDTYTSSPVKNASKGDILFSVRAPVGDINIAQDDLCIGRGICAIKSKTGENGFLFYLLKNNVKRLISQANGTVFISVNRGDLESFEVVIPSSPDYRTRISNILSTIDRKIKLNNQINNNLEQQAMTLFKSWFIDYEPFDKQVPTTWKYGVLGDFVEIKRGGSPRPIQNFLSNRGLHWLKISDATCISSPFVNEIKEYIIEEGLKKTVFLKAGSLVLSNSATPGLPKILDIATCIHDGWLYFPSSKFSNEYLYLYFKYIRNNLVALGNGSVFTNLKTDILKNYPTNLPTDNVLNKFDEIVKPIFSMIRSRTRESKRLIKIRDTLLPKLMSGELDLSDIDL